RLLREAESEGEQGQEAEEGEGQVRGGFPARGSECLSRRAATVSIHSRRTWNGCAVHELGVHPCLRRTLPAERGDDARRMDRSGAAVHSGYTGRIRSLLDQRG